MARRFKDLDVVALLCDFPEVGLVQGQVGTIVETLEGSAYEVEFCDDDGKAYAMLAIEEDEMMLLHYSRVEAA